MTYRILSLDGGGIRGIVTAVILGEIEQQVGQPLNEYFDIIAGTSTGSLLAAAVATGGRSQQIIELYRNDGPNIFPYRSLFSPQRLPLLLQYGFSAPKYSDANLSRVLQRYFGNKKLSDVKNTKLLITAYDLLRREPLIFKSWRGDKPYFDVPIWEACLCSASAPTLFPAHELRTKEEGMAMGAGKNTIFLTTDASSDMLDYQNMQLAIVSGTGSGQTRSIKHYDPNSRVAVVDKDWDTVPDSTSRYRVSIEYLVIDGGVGANNPAACALAEAIRLIRQQETLKQNQSQETPQFKDLISDISVLSIGTGDVSQQNMQKMKEDARGRGLIRWVLSGELIQVLFDASSAIEDYITKQVMTGRDETNSGYLRLQPQIPKDNIDDASQKHLDDLVQVAQNFVKLNKSSLKNFFKS